MLRRKVQVKWTEPASNVFKRDRWKQEASGNDDTALYSILQAEFERYRSVTGSDGKL